METPSRSIVKAITWQLLGLLTMTGLGFLLTGNLSTAGSMALGAAGLGFVCFILHERVWARIGWGRR